MNSIIMKHTIQWIYTLDALGDGYTYEEVHAVFMAERKKQVKRY